MLQSFGLGKIDSSLYIHLLKSGTLTAKEIAQELNIPNTKIYSYLNSLIERGLLVKTNTRPTTYLAISPKDAIANLINTKKDEMLRIEREAREIEFKLNEITSIRTVDSNFITLNTGKNLRQKTHATMVEAEISLDVLINLTNRHFSNLMGHTQAFFQRADQVSKSGADVRLILGVNERKMNELKLIIEKMDLSPTIQIHTTGSVHTFFYIIDNTKVLIKITDPVTNNFDFASIIIWEPELARTFENKFNILWDTSENFRSQ